MAKTKLETIQDTISSLKSLGMPVPYDLLIERNKEERALSDKRVKDAVDLIKTTVEKSLSGIDCTIDIHIHSEKGKMCSLSYSVENNPTINTDELRKEYQQLNVKYSKAIVVYVNGYKKCNDLLHSQVDKSAITTLDISNNDTYCLLLVSYMGCIFAISKGLLNFQAQDKLICPPQFKHRIDDAFICKASDKLEVIYTDETKEILRATDFPFRNATGFAGPIKTKEILNIRIK